MQRLPVDMAGKQMNPYTRVFQRDTILPAGTRVRVLRRSASGHPTDELITVEAGERIYQVLAPVGLLGEDC